MEYKDGLIITIITATYNAAECLPFLAMSIREQSYRRVQWIVLDGGSTDGTIDVIKKNEDIIDAWLSEPDKGIYDAWNKALRLVRGDWILFMGADDRFADSQVLFNVSELLKPLGSDVLWTYGQIIFMGSNGRNQSIGEPWEDVKNKFGFGMVVPHQAVFHRRELFERLGGFDHTYRIAGDYALLLRAVKAGYSPVFFSLCVTHMGSGGLSSHPKTALASLLENSRARRTAGVRPLFPWPWVWGTCKAFVKLLLSTFINENQLRKVVNSYRCITGRPML